MALPSTDLEALNLDGVTMATLRAVGKRAGCTADFPKKSKQTALSFLVDHREAKENGATAASTPAGSGGRRLREASRGGRQLAAVGVIYMFAYIQTKTQAASY